MPQTSNPDKNNPQITTLTGYSHTIHHTFATDPLQHLHHEVSDELVRRLLGPQTPANPNLVKITATQLQGFLDDIFTRMTTILSTAETTRDEIRCANRDQDRGLEGSLPHFSSAKYDALAKVVGLDKQFGEAKYYSNDEDIAVEWILEWAYEVATDKTNQEWTYEDVTDKMNPDWAYKDPVEETPEPPCYDDDGGNEDAARKRNQEWAYEDGFDGPVDWSDNYADDYGD